MNKEKYTFIELFSGAGGLALGLHQAGFYPLALVDFNKDANKTIKTNFPKWNVIEENIKNLSDQDLPFEDVDLISGGFPCQPFSYAGNKLGLEDTRGTSFYAFAKIIKNIQPKMILLENVKGLLSHDKGRTFNTIKQILNEIGYCLDYKVLNAWDYNVPQKRERLFIVGIHQSVSSDVVFEWPAKDPRRPVLREALKDVPKSEGYSYPKDKKQVLDMVPEGGTWVDLPDEVAREYMGKSYYTSGGKRGFCKRLAWDEPSVTLTCSPSQKRTERCHPEETRPLTIREYARVQTFPDDYMFFGSLSSQYKQIGNAVPVELAKRIGLSIIKTLEKIKTDDK